MNAFCRNHHIEIRTVTGVGPEESIPEFLKRGLNRFLQVKYLSALKCVSQVEIKCNTCISAQFLEPFIRV